jgi:itaconate CoA-transferase
VNGAPLDGVLVVAVEQAVAAPFATRQLADLGARVIKVERPGTGDFARHYDTRVAGLSSVFVWLNRGKESVELDIKSAGGRRVLDALLERADVFIHNIAPDAAAGLGLDSKTLQVSYPRLIAASVSGYGNGPLAASKAYDLLVQGETGLLSLSGDDDHYARVGLSIVDISAGMYAYAGIVAALHHRSRTGEALPVDVSLFDSLTEWLSYPLYWTMYGGEPPRRTGTRHAMIVPYGAYATAGGELIMLAVQSDAEWVRFCELVLEDPGVTRDERFATNERRVVNRAALDDRINATLGALGRKAVIDRLERAGLAYARVNRIEELATHEQLRSDSRWTTTGTEAGPVRTVLPPWLPPGRAERLGDVPALGQHTRTVLDWLGLSDPETVTREGTTAP